LSLIIYSLVLAASPSIRIERLLRMRLLHLSCGRERGCTAWWRRGVGLSRWKRRLSRIQVRVSVARLCVVPAVAVGCW
jgi:hypothetical protein